MSALREGITGFGGLPIIESSETSTSPTSEKIPEFGSPEHRAKISQQSIDEAVKLRENLKERVEYMSPLLPLSYEGAALLCTLIALKKNKFQKLMCLPPEDVQTILLHLHKDYNNSTFNVEFDADNNFNMLFFMSSKKVHPFTIQLKNIVVNKEIDDGGVPIIDDKENDTIQIGPIKATKEALKSMCGIKTLPELSPTVPQITNTVNKNAYEIRTDILEMALDFVKYKWDGSPGGVSDSDVLETARKFYNFVENRR